MVSPMSPFTGSPGMKPMRIAFGLKSVFRQNLNGKRLHGETTVGFLSGGMNSIEVLRILEKIFSLEDLLLKTKVLPSAVSEHQQLNTNESYKHVDYNQLSALFIEAIKELKEQNEELKAEVEKLKSINSNS